MPPETKEPFSLPLRDIVPAEEFAPGSPTPLWIWIVVVGVLALAILAFLRWRSSSASPSVDEQEKKNAAFDAARSDILETRKSADQKPATETAVALSLALRRYLGVAVDDPALFQTHEEFVLSADALAAIPAAGRQQTRDFFDQLAALKYAPQGQAGDALNPLCDQSLELLNRLHMSQTQTPLPA